MLQTVWRAAIEALMLLMAAVAAAQDKTAVASTVEVRVQMSWWMEPSRGHPLVALVTLEPLDRKGASQSLQISESSTSIVRLPAGRYQLITTNPMVINGQAYGWSIEVPLVAPVNYIRLSQENAVRLSMGDAIEGAAPNLNPLPAAPAANHITTDVAARPQIMALLKRWTTSFQSRNLQVQMSCYAPRLASYLDQRNVSREQVQLQKRKLLRLYTQIRLELSDIDLRFDAGQATVTAVESWNFGNDEVNWRGRALVDFEFAKINSRWVITSQRQRPVPEHLATEQ